MNIGLFFKRLFCNHIDRLVTNEYLYSAGIRILGEFRPFREYYAKTFECVKCGRTHIIEVRVEVL